MPKTTRQHADSVPTKPRQKPATAKPRTPVINNDLSFVLEAVSAGLRGESWTSYKASRRKRMREEKDALTRSEERWHEVLLNFRGEAGDQTRAEHRLTMDTQLDMFVTDHDPIALLRCFVMAMDLEVIPPAPILTAVKEAFQQVLDGQGGITLDTAMKLTGTKQGQWTAVARNRTDNEQKWLATILFDLTEGFGFTGIQAAERLNRFIETHPGIITLRQADDRSESLRDQYTRTWKEKFRFDTITPADFRHPHSWSPAFQDRFLKQFPDPATCP
jgi:hypothetical protein